MGKVWVECWQCDVCGYRWIIGDVGPMQCASSKCRSRKWNLGVPVLDKGIRTGVVRNMIQSASDVEKAVERRVPAFIPVPNPRSVVVVDRDLVYEKDEYSQED